MDYRNGIGSSLPGANYTTMGTANSRSEVSGEIKKALKDFLLKHPEMAADPRKMEVLQYCFKHYVNFDPDLRDLSITEKLERANQMAVDFMGSMLKF